MRRVALVHDFLSTKFGGAEQVLAVLSELFPEAPIFTLLYDEERMGKVFPKTRVVPSSAQNLPFLRRHQQLLLPYFPLAVERFDLTDFDLVISSSSAFAKGVITRPDTVHISYTHTPTQYLWNQTHRYTKELGFGPLRTALARLFMNYVRVWDRLAADRVDHFIANSKTVARRIGKYYRRESTVIYPPVTTTGFPEPKPGEYFLVVSTLAPYKRVDLAVEAASRLSLPLVVAGTGSDERRLRRLAGPTVRFAGFVDRPQLLELYAGAAALIFPAEEDFGITAVEAMAAGKPVIAYGKGGVTETVLPGVTGAFFDEMTALSLGGVLEQFDAARYAAEACRARAAEFDRSVFEQKLKVYIGDVSSAH